MGENADPVARLKAIGIEVPEYAPEQETSFAPFLLEDRQLLISATPPYFQDIQSAPRLNLDANVDLDADFQDLPEDHPLRLAIIATRLATIRVLSIAQSALDGDLSKISYCSRAGLNVRTGPNFERLGMVFLPVNRLFTTAFGRAPVFNISGVAALPGGAALTLETTFRLQE